VSTGLTGFTRLPGDEHAERPFIARMLHSFSVPIILFWLAIAVILSVFVPSLEEVGQERSVSMSPADAPSVIALRHIGRAFNEGQTDSVAMIVLEGDKTLGDDAHRFYDTLIRRLREDKAHVLSIQDFWGDPLTAAGAQSNDGKAVTVQVNLAGNQGEPLANESVDAVRKIVDATPAPPGVKAYVTGASALTADLHKSHGQDHRNHGRGDSVHAPVRLPLGGHRDSVVGHGWFRIGHCTWSRRGGRA
jgi:RND superfamily putative drug exporter